MSRSISPAARASVNASSTAEVWLTLVKLTHSSFDEPVCIVRNTEAVTSNGTLYSPFPFDVNLPDEEAEQLTVVNWVALNASNELIEKLRGVTGKIDGTISLVLASQPDIVEVTMDLEMRAFEYDAETINGSMTTEPILDAVFGTMTMDPNNAPGLF